MLHADHKLALRLEALIATEFRRLAEVGRGVLPGAGSECREVAGGVALWLGEGSPVNQAAGLGMGVLVEDAQLEELEDFYHERGADAATSVCPLADPSLLAALAQRGWTMTEFEHVLALELSENGPGGTEGLPGGAGAPQAAAGTAPEVRVCTREEREIWAQVATLGFADGVPVTPGQEEFSRLMAAREEAVLVLGWVNGRPAGTGALVIDGGVGWLSGDSTLPQFRRRGVQQAIQRHRLQLAHAAGCDLAVTEAAPGGASQRNMERLGFRIVYTHVEFVRPRPSGRESTDTGARTCKGRNT